jgi:hypothetical protein
MPVTPLGFDFQRFPPPSSRHAFRRALPFLLFAPTPKRRTAAPRIDAPGRSVHDGPVLPGVHRPSLSEPSIPPRVSPPGPGLHASTKPPLMGFSATLSVWPRRYWAQAPSRRDRPSPRLLYRVSKSPEVGLPLSRAASLRGIYVLLACRSTPFGLPVAALLRANLKVGRAQPRVAPFEEYHRARLAHWMSPPGGPPLIALARDPESLRRTASVVLVERSRPDLAGRSPHRWPSRSSPHDVMWRCKHRHFVLSCPWLAFRV